MCSLAQCRCTHLALAIEKDNPLVGGIQKPTSTLLRRKANANVRMTYTLNYESYRTGTTDFNITWYCIQLHFVLYVIS